MKRGERKNCFIQRATYTFKHLHSCRIHMLHRVSHQPIQSQLDYWIQDRAQSCSEFPVIKHTGAV